MSATAETRSLPMLDRLAGGSCRYNALLDDLETVPAKVLTQTLKRLEALADEQLRRPCAGVR